MTDMADALQTLDKRKNEIVRAIIMSGWVLTLLLMVGIVGAALWLMLTGHEVPKTLEQWGSVALGFLFGSFSKMISDYIAGG